MGITAAGPAPRTGGPPVEIIVNHWTDADSANTDAAAEREFGSGSFLRDRHRPRPAPRPHQRAKDNGLRSIGDPSWDAAIEFHPSSLTTSRTRRLHRNRIADNFWGNFSGFGKNRGRAGFARARRSQETLSHGRWSRNPRGQKCAHAATARYQTASRSRCVSMARAIPARHSLREIHDGVAGRMVTAPLDR